MKKLGIAAAVLVAIAAAGLFWLRGNVDGLVKEAIVTYGSAMTQAQVSVGSVELRAGDGTGVIRGLTIGNPAGFKTAYALKVDTIEIGIDMSSLTKDVILIRKIAIQAPAVIYEKGDGLTNFDQIQKNIAAYLGPADAKRESGKKLIVEELTIPNAKAEASAAFMQGKTVAVPLPDIALRNIGKAKGGVPPGEVGQEIANALKQKLTSAINFDGLAKSAGQSLEKAGSAVKGLFGLK